MSPLSDRNAEAIQWVVRRELAGAAADPAFERWLREDARNPAAFARAQAVSQLMNWGLRKMAIAREVTPAPAPRASNASTWFAALAALVLIVIGLGHQFAFRGHLYETEIGGFHRITLDDGSVVELNTNSALRVPKWGERRTVYLERGEAHFKVARDSSRPFYVRAGTTVVRAVGTEFDVRRYIGDSTRVVVSEGKVAIGETNATLVGAGQLAKVDSGRARLSSLDSDQLDSLQRWRDRQIVLTGDTLANVVREMNRYNRRQIVLTDPTIADTEIGGVFRADDPEAFARWLRNAGGIQYRATPARIELFSPGFHNDQRHGDE